MGVHPRARHGGARRTDDAVKLMATKPDENLPDPPATPDETPGDDWGGDDAFTGDADDWAGEPGEDSSQRDADQDGTSDAGAEITPMDQAVWHAPRGPRTRIVAALLLLFIAISVVALAVMAILALVK